MRNHSSLQTKANRDYYDHHESAVHLLVDSRVASFFRLTAQEKTRYGSTPLGAACFIARNLVAAGSGTHLILCGTTAGTTTPRSISGRTSTRNAPNSTPDGVPNVSSTRKTSPNYSRMGIDVSRKIGPLFGWRRWGACSPPLAVALRRGRRPKARRRHLQQCGGFRKDYENRWLVFRDDSSGLPPTEMIPKLTERFRGHQLDIDSPSRGFPRHTSFLRQPTLLGPRPRRNRSRCRRVTPTPFEPRV